MGTLCVGCLCRVALCDVRSPRPIAPAHHHPGFPPPHSTMAETLGSVGSHGSGNKHPVVSAAGCTLGCTPTFWNSTSILKIHEHLFMFTRRVGRAAAASVWVRPSWGGGPSLPRAPSTQHDGPSKCMGPALLMPDAVPRVDHSQCRHMRRPAALADITHRFRGCTERFPYQTVPFCQREWHPKLASAMAWKRSTCFCHASGISRRRADARRRRPDADYRAPSI